MPYRSSDQRFVTPQNRGRYPGYDVLDQSNVWDDVTAGVVLARLSLPNEMVFFTASEVAVAAPLLDRLLNQDSEPRVPVLAMIDERLAQGETDGWHYDDLPEDGDAWRASLAALDSDARITFAAGFSELAASRQACLIQDVQELSSDSQAWHGLPAKHVWSLWTRYACTAFYSHPWAWNEIGFGGPAYPRGYLNVGLNAREKWERADPSAKDPVPFAACVEQARSEHDQLLGRDDS